MFIEFECKNCAHWKGTNCELDIGSRIGCLFAGNKHFVQKPKLIINMAPRHMKVGWLKRLAEQIEEDEEKENKNMGRLTYKKDGLYYPTKEGEFYTTPDDGSNACRLLQVIGRYEDKEEPASKFNFSKALDLLKEGKRVAREGWNGKGLFVYMVAGGDYKVQMDSVKHLADENNCLHYEPYLAIKNVKGTINTWVPSISDLMAEDWVLA